MYSSLAVLPLHLACQILIADNSSTDLAVNLNLGEKVLNEFIRECDNPFARDSPLPKSAIDLPDGYAVFPEIGVAYKIYKNKLSWNNARKICLSEGGYLATIDSFEKNKIATQLKETASSLWVGIHRMFDSDEWTDVRTGLPPSSIPWAPSGTHESNKSRKCISLWHAGNGVWAVDCSETYSFICELPLFKE